MKLKKLKYTVIYTLVIWNNIQENSGIKIKAIIMIFHWIIVINCSSEETKLDRRKHHLCSWHPGNNFQLICVKLILKPQLTP